MDGLKMFTKFPQKLPDPFNFLGDQPKLAFRNQPGGIANSLLHEWNISEKESYWDQYVTLFDSASDVFSLITHNDVRRALLEAPENVATLVRVISARLFNLVSDHTFPAPPATLAATLIRTGSGITGAAGERNATKEALNCLRILQRVLPVIFELESESSRFEREVLWKRVPAPDGASGAGGPAVEVASAEPQFVIEDEDEDGSDEGDAGAPKSPPPQTAAAEKPREMLPSIAERLFSCLIDLMFCCGFTLPTKIQVDHYKINYIIWEKGIGSTADPGPSQQHESNKTEVLRLLLVLLSRQIYSPPSALFTSPSQYTLHFVQTLPRRDVLTVLCSLMNTAMNASHPPPSPVNVVGAVGAVAGRLPYNHLLLKGEDPRTSLISLCFQVLCVLLDFQSGPARDDAGGPTAKTNAFRYFIAKLHRPNDLSFILHGLVGIFEEQIASISGLLPGAKKSVPYMVEAITFLWKMVELNKKFRAYLLDSDKATDVLAYLLCYGLEIKDKPEQHGMCRVLSYLIQSLSAERGFGLKLSSPIKAQIPQKFMAMGNAGDFMIQSIYSMIATTSGNLNSLYPALIIALSNSAPYLKNLHVTSSARLLQLFTAFSNPSFLLSDEGHPRLLFFMLEAFTSILLHNLSENPNVIYGLIRAHKQFEDLGTFTLARGLREIRRVQQTKEERARQKQDAATAKGKRRITDEEQGDPASEKARLLSREAAGSLDLPRASESLDSLPQPGAAAAGDDDAPPSTAHPLMSPGEAPIAFNPTPPPAARSSSDGPPGISEKARGKMRAAGRSLSGDMTGSLERLAAAGVGRNGFVPTQEWVASWHQGLPLDVIMLVIAELLPKVQSLQNSLSATTANSAIIDLLRSANVEHALPKAPPLSPRRFMWSDASIVWLTSLIWGEIYVRGMTPLGIWNSTSVRLFYVKHAPQTQQRQITETVTNVMGGLLGRTESSQSLGRRQ
ncbi:high-temperature-induced dauer-formation protein-domain-containing protein [Epithele typhae]|uniref:high-temperature-induced dauer-formation protein-domain-containing protein n=1 Tax=Epithele typhae TaxID=378194 RepID=UPI002007E9D2|nr:high-temperature-induced dauer-formation protein-domain-containing protein [Epithele typhae]KAH9946300.1 high-temperature-induced dauer-formation protein-domain-containing protein [Epithele typhae]